MNSTNQKPSISRPAPKAPGTRSIREDVLRNPEYPVHQIADRLAPYLQVLVEQFHPERVILFGSYAYGQPDQDSDVDLLIIKEIAESSLKDKIEIRRAWHRSLHSGVSLPFDLIVVSPQRHRERLENTAGFYDGIVGKGLVLV